MSQDDERRSRSEGFREGIRQGLGVLSALKEAVEETIREARGRGDLSSERAREIMKDAMNRAQTAADQARERFDFASQRELDDLRREVKELAVRIARLEEMAAEPVADAGTAGPEGGQAQP